MDFQPMYTLTELAKLSGMSRARLHRLLLARQVRLMTDSRPAYVFLSDLRTALPELWESLVICQGARPLIRS